MSFANFQISFLISALLRLTALLFLSPVVDAGSAPAREVLQEIGRSSPRSWRDIRRLKRATGEEGRLKATGALAGTRSRLAASELEGALNDPSLAVREEAARSLGEIGDPGSVGALIEVLADPASGLADEAAWALGRIGDRRANGPLIAVLNAPDKYTHADRLAAIRALGELGGADAAHTLTGMLHGAAGLGDDDAAEATVRALGQIGDRLAVTGLMRLMEAPTTSRRLRLALIRSLGELGDRRAAPDLRTALKGMGSDLSLLPALGDALARLADFEAVVPLVERLDEMESEVARKQVASAIGTLIGEGEPLYALLSSDEYGRAHGAARLFQEMDRRIRLSMPALVRALAEARDAWLVGNIADSLHGMIDIARALPEGGVQRALCLRLLERMEATAGRPLPAEAGLVALFALRRIVLGEESEP